MLLAATALGLWLWAPWTGAERERPAALAKAPGERPATEELRGSACRELAAIATGLAEGEPAPDAFLGELGRRAAGIRPPPHAYGDLARGGSDEISGGGFRARFDDGSPGQARHFAGVAVAVSLGGGQATRLISAFARDDPPRSPDGRLTAQAIEFADRLRQRDLSPSEAPRWLLRRLCLPRR